MIIRFEQLDFVVRILVLGDVNQIQNGKIFQFALAVNVRFIFQARLWINGCSIYIAIKQAKTLPFIDTIGKISPSIEIDRSTYSSV